VDAIHNRHARDFTANADCQRGLLITDCRAANIAGMARRHSGTHRPHWRRRTRADPFDRVREAARSLPDVEETTKYDRSPVLKVGGCFMAGLARDPRAEPNTLVVRVDLDQRALLLDEAPAAYYINEYHERYPVVLVRLPHVDDAALRDLLSASWRLTVAKAGAARRSPRRRRARIGRSRVL
jgi:hypothetical protein